MRPIFVLSLLLAVSQDQSAGPLLRLGSSHWRPGGGVHAIAFSPDDKLIATAIAEHITLWDSATGRWRVSSRAPDCTTLLFARGSGTLLFNTGDRIGRWDLAKPRSTPRHTRGFIDPAGTASLAPDGSRLAVLDGENLLIKGTTGRIIQRLQARDALTVAWFPDSRTLAVAGLDGFVHLWDTQEGKDLRKFKFGQPSDSVPPAENVRMTVAGDGQLLVVAAVVARDKDDLPPATEIYTIDTITGRRLKVPRLHDGLTGSLAASPDGTLIISGNRTELCLWEALSGAVIRSIGDAQAGLGQAALTPDGLGVVMIADGALRYADLQADGDRLLALGEAGITCVAFSNSGQLLATGHSDRIVQVWRTEDLFKRPPAEEVSVQQSPALWQALGADARAAYLARRTLVSAPKLAVQLLRERLQPQTPPSAEQVAAWITELNAEPFKVRDKATQALEQWPELAEAPLRKALEGKPTLEARRRVESLLDKFASERPVGEVLRSLRAIACLQTIGTEETRPILSRLVDGGSNLRIRQAAKAALERLPAAEGAK
jgi:WD40 repeat protein